MPAKRDVFYKVLGDEQQSMHGGTGVWTRGKRRVARGPLLLCQNGIHLCRRQNLVSWLGPQIWVAEPYGVRVEAQDKTVVRGATLVRRLSRWNERTARLFAADVAERALLAHNWTAESQPALFAAVRAARDFAEGTISDEARSAAGSAAWSAARSAAESAAESAAWSAARAAQTELLFEYLTGKRGARA